MAFCNEMTNGESILVNVTGRETLVGHVEEWEVFLFLDEVGELSPLSFGGVDTGRVVGACVEEDDGLGGSGLSG